MVQKSVSLQNIIIKNKLQSIFIIVWIFTVVGLGSLMGFLSKTEINTWYTTLNQSPLTPPNYIFPIAWTILYGLIGSCGFLIWKSSPFHELKTIKVLYIFQLLLNLSWTPLFFHYHLPEISLIVLIMMDFIVNLLIYFSYQKIRLVSFLLIPYLLWLFFASYLNLYILQNN
jgi:tryptophan-rich sensory protein